MKYDRYTHYFINSEYDRIGPPVCADEPDGCEGPACTLDRGHEGPHKEERDDVTISWEYTNG